MLVLTSAFERLDDVLVKRNCSRDFSLDSTWQDLCWRIELFNIIQNLDIEGVTGRIRFQNGDRLGEIVIEQILVSPSPKMKSVEIVKLFVAVPTNHSKYVLLPAKNGRNMTWHGENTFFF